MTTIVALYRGDSIAEAKIVAASSDPELAAYVAGELLTERRPEEDRDPVLREVGNGRRRALRLIEDEAQNDPR